MYCFFIIIFFELEEGIKSFSPLLDSLPKNDMIKNKLSITQIKGAHEND